MGHVGLRVADILSRLGEHVVIISLNPVRENWRKKLPPSRVRFVVGDATNTGILDKAGITKATAVIITTDNDLANISIMLDAKKKNPAVNVVIRLFNHKLAEDIETHLGVQRALSVPVLASPAFTAASLGMRHLDSFTALDGTYSVMRLRITSERAIVARKLPESPDSHIVAILRGREALFPRENFSLRSGDEILLLSKGANLTNHLAELVEKYEIPAMLNSPVSTGKSGLKKILDRLRDAVSFLRRLSFAARLLIVSVIGITTVSTVVFHHALKIPVLDALYFVVATITTTGYGDINLLNASPVVKVYGIFLMLAGAALIASAFSLITNFIFRLRFRELLRGVRVRKNRHIIVAGLGSVGLRLVKQLAKAGERVVVVDKNADTELRQLLPVRIPFVQGDAALPETLVTANITAAKSVVAVTGNDITNLSIGLLSKKLNPNIRTTLRLFDPDLAEKVQGGMGIDHVISASASSAPAFVASALLPAVRHCLVWGSWLVVFCDIAAEKRPKDEKFSRWRQVGAGLDGLTIVARPLVDQS